MLDITNFGAFIVAGILLNLIPGPDTFYILGRSVAQGKQIGIASALGISCGALFHTFLSAIGLSALIMASATAYTIVKALGAIYLLILGIRLLFSKYETLDSVVAFRGSLKNAFVQGMMTNVLNPKVAIFFLAFLPQFIVPNGENSFLSFLILGLVFVMTSTIWGLVIASMSARISRGLRKNRKFGAYLNKAVGGLFICFGVKVALEP